MLTASTLCLHTCFEHLPVLMRLLLSHEAARAHEAVAGCGLAFVTRSHTCFELCWVMDSCASNYDLLTWQQSKLACSSVEISVGSSYESIVRFTEHVYHIKCAQVLDKNTCKLVAAEYDLLMVDKDTLKVGACGCCRLQSPLAVYS